MRTMGTLSTFIEPIESNMVVGRQIAAASFLQALLSYSNFERIDFSLPNSYCSIAFLQDKLQSAMQAPGPTSLYHILRALKQGLVRLT
jgi:hypothetical protein